MYAEGTLALVLRLCACAGVAPLRTRRAGAGCRFQVSKLRAALHAVVMTTINIMTVTGIYFELHLHPEQRIHAGDTVVQTLIWIADFTLAHTIVSLAIYRGCAQMESLQRVVNQLQQVKFDLNMRRPPAKMLRIKSVATFAMLTWMGAIMMTDFVMYENEAVPNGGDMWKINLCLGVIHIVDLMGKLTVLKWTSMVLAVLEGATAVNNHLKRLRHDTVFSQPATDESVKETEALIRRLALSHVRISDVMREINASNGLFLVVLLTFISLQIIIIPYYMLFQEDVYGMALSLNWMAVHLTVLTLIIEPCQWTHSQRQQTVFLLGQMIVHRAPTSERLTKELELFAKQLTLSETKFCALGIYTLDRQLTAAMLGGVATYLVIVIQFHKASN